MKNTERFSNKRTESRGLRGKLLGPAAHDPFSSFGNCNIAGHVKLPVIATAIEDRAACERYAKMFKFQQLKDLKKDLRSHRPTPMDVNN